VRFAVVRDIEAETGCEKSPSHVWEREEQEGSAAEGVDGPDRGLSYVLLVDRDRERGSVIVLTQAKTKLTRPKPKLAMRASRSLAPACLNTVEL
jgi:hypothetical protein